jgi:hypothetical protein
MKQEDSDGTVRVFSARACAAPLEKKEKSKAIWPSAVLVLVITINANCSQSSRGTYYVGRRFPSERMTYKDSVTGLEIFMLTTSSAKDNKIYQTHPNWTADGSNNGPFYKETYDEWVTHEVWWGPKKVLFTIWPKNEQMLKKPYGIAYITLQDRALNILSQKKYWHVGGSPDGKWAVGDTFDGELYLIKGDTGEAKLLTQGHRPRGATVHPHPSFSPDGSSILFCSEKNGNWDLFLVQLKQQVF